MSLKLNVLANYAGQFYVTLIGIALVPLYVKYMGSEAYGLVGFYSMAQAWFMLLDIGLTPTMARETSRFNGGATDAVALRRLLRTLEGIFIGVAIIGAGALLVGSTYIANSWLKVQQLPLSEVEISVKLIAIIIAMRWVGGLYRSTINGFEKMIWLNGFNIVIATVRFAFIIPYLIFITSTPTGFFYYQLAIGLIELTVLMIQSYRLMPGVHMQGHTPWQWQPLQRVLKFSITVAFTGAVWVIVTQTDKLILSGILSLTDYAYFTLAALAASGVTIICGPISNALVPRMTKINAAGDQVGLVNLYRSATQIVTISAISAALVLSFFAEQLLWVWSGNMDIARIAAPVLALYAIGNGVLAVAAFPYYLQFAKGDLTLHLISNAIFICIYLPLLYWATRKFGMIGAGFAWIAANLIPFIFWLPIVHRHFFMKLHAKWLTEDILIIMALPIGVVCLLKQVLVWPKDRPSVAAILALVSIVVLCCAAIGSSWARKTMISTWRSVH